MYGDTDVMRKHASRLREQGEEIRAMADQLVAQAEAVAWAGRAGDAMRDRIRDRAADLREAATATTAPRRPSTPHPARRRARATRSPDRAAGFALLDDGALPRFEPPRRATRTGWRSPCRASVTGGGPGLMPTIDLGPPSPSPMTCSTGCPVGWP